MQDHIDTLVTQLKTLQHSICAMAEHQDGEATFLIDDWQRSEGGGGISCVLQNGAVFEQAGVNFSVVHGKNLPPSASAHRPELAGRDFIATGVSVVMHPQNPYAPTSHFNVRFFCAQKPGHDPVWWYGGGFDLTPYYGFEEDCVLWHEHAKAACDAYGDERYAAYKKWCDDYFYLKHRQEARGIGGIFFDDVQDLSLQTGQDFILSVGQHYLDAYQAIITRRKDVPFGEQERQFQLYRRGRYVEYNLVYDRGTLFGLQSGGRTESILMSLPPIVHWRYNWQPEPGSKEAELYERFLPTKDWLK